MKNIVFVSNPGAWGGCEMLLVEYLAAVDSTVYNVTLVTTNDLFSDPIAKRKLDHVSVIQLPFPLKGESWGRFFNLKKFFKNMGPVEKIVFFPGAFNVFKWSDYLAAYLKVKGEVYSVENSGPFEPPKRESKKHFKIIPGIGMWWYKRMLFTKLRTIFCKRILAVGQEVRTRMIQWYGYPQEKVVVAYTGVHLDKFAPDPEMRRQMRDEQGYSDQDILIISTARLSPEKRLDRLMKAFAKIQDDKVNLVFVGDGPLENELRDLAEKLNVRPRVRFVGFQKNIENFLKMSDIYVLPSDMEGFSIAMLEAMATGLIPVRTNTCGAREIILDGKNGLIVDCSVSGVYAGLKQVLEISCEQRKSIASRARNTMEENFDFSRNINKAIEYLGLGV